MKSDSSLCKEDGAVVIVEAVFIFPVMFLVLIFLIYFGNAYYIKAQVESVVARAAISGAAQCADPFLSYIEKKGSAPGINVLDKDGGVWIEPYRFLVGGFGGGNGTIGRAKQDTVNWVKKAIASSTFSFFKNMKPVITTRDSDIASYNNFILYSTFSVQVSCKLRLPVRIIGESASFMLNLNAYSEVAVHDAAEFVRNTDMVIDYFEDKMDKVKDIFGKINDFLSMFSK